MDAEAKTIERLTLSQRCRIHAGKMDEEGWYVTANVLSAAGDDLDGLVAALKPLAFCDDSNPPPGVEVEHWRPAVLAARAAIAKATGQ